MKEIFRTAYKQINQIYTPDRAAILIISLGLLIRIPLILFSSEVWRSADTASIAHFFGVNGFKILYPQIYWGGNGPGYVEAEFQLYPFIVSLLYSILGEHMWIGRFVSLLFSTVTIITFYLLVKKILNQREALWSLIMFSLSLIFLRYSTAFMPEATMMCFYVGGLYFFTKWLDKRRFLFLLLACLSTSIAILVKPSAIHIGLLFALLAIYRFGYKSLLGDWKIWFMIVLCLFPVVLYYSHAHYLFIEYGNTFGVLFGGDSKFGNLIYWSSPEFYLGLIQIEFRWVFGPLGIFVFMIGFIQSIIKRSYFLLLSVITIVIYYLIIARYSGYSRGIQYHIFMAPFAAIGFGIGIEALINSRFRKIGNVLAWISIFTIVLVSAKLYGGMLKAVILQTGGNDIFFTCASWVQKVVPADSLIVVSNPYTSIDDQGIPNNYQEPMVFFYSQRRGWSLPTDWMNPEKFEELRQLGAKYYVILDRDQHLLEANPGLLNYLDANFNQIISGFESACQIYQFK
jgi:4-amino-4-deoxy-L-arabinose transferase-like glycosyltransferase